MDSRGVAAIDPAIAMRRALLRKALAAELHRAAVADVLELSASEVLALQHLAFAGQLTPSQLRRRLRLTSGGGTGLLHRLERCRCVLREPHPTDRRSVRVRLTPELERRLGDVLTPLRDGIDRVVGALGPGERAVVQRFLDDVSELSERHADMLRSTAEASRTADVRLQLPPLWA